MIEDPKYIEEYKIKLDYMYYLEHQIEKPVLQIFDLVMKDSNILLKDIKNKYLNNKTGQTEITKWFKKS